MATRDFFLLSVAALGLGAVVGVVACGGAVGAGARGDELTVASTGDSSGSVARDRVALDGPADEEGGRAFRLGFHRRYALDVRTATALDARTTLAFRVRASLDVAFVDVSEGLRRVRLQLHEPSLDVSNAPAVDPAMGRSLETALASPFFVAIDARGHVVQLMVPRETPAIVRGLQKHVASLLQYEHAPQASWESWENDPTGEVVTRYARAEGSLSRTKLRYRRILAADGLVAPSAHLSVSVEGTARYELDAERWPRRLDAHETSKITGDTQLAPVVVTLDASLALESAEDDRSALGSLERGRSTLMPVTLTSLEVFAEAKHDADAQLVGKLTTESLIARLEAAKTDEERAQLHATVSAMARLDEGAADRLVRRGRSHDRVSMEIVGGLGASGSESSQRALVSLLEDARAIAEARVDAAIALGQAPSPSLAALEGLRAATHDANADIANTATLAAANASRGLRETEPEAAAQTVDEILRRLDASADPSEQAMLLRALGNSGDPRSLPRAVAFSQSRLPELRAAAVHAVQYLVLPEADELVIARMHGDSDVDVRIESLRVATYRAPEPLVAAVAVTALRDEAAAARHAAAQALAAYFPDLRAFEALERVAKADPSPEVRSDAARLVAAWRATPKP